MLVVISQYENWISKSILRYFAEFSEVKEVYFRRKSPVFSRLPSKSQIVAIYLFSLPLIFVRMNVIKKSTVYLTGLHFPFFLICKLFSVSFKNVVLDNFYIHDLSRNKLFVKLLSWMFRDKYYTLIVQSQYEVDFFSKIGRELKVVFIPYCLTRVELPLEIQIPFQLPQKYIFAGGGTNRDYETLIMAAKSFPDIYFVCIATRFDLEAPANVLLLQNVHPNIFNKILSLSFCVVVPLKHQVGSSGQMVCLTAMQFGKPIIYSDNSSINHYFIDKYNGYSYVPGDVKSLSSQIQHVMSLNSNEIDMIYQTQVETFNNNFSDEIRNEKIIKLLSNL